jgi:transposase InsO family protein
VNILFNQSSQCFITCYTNTEQCDLEQDWSNVEHVLFTPSAQMQDKYQLFFAHCVTPVTEHNIINVHVINLSQKLIRLWSGMACGTVEPCSKNNVTFFTNTRGQPLLHESSLACPEPHVHFCNTTEKTDSASTNIYSSQELASTAAWIKTSGLDCDLTQFQTDDKRQILQLLTEFKDVFAQHSTDYGLCNLPNCEHTIDIVPGAPPVRLPPHRATPPTREIIDKETQSMLQAGIIRPSDGQWTAPVVLVKKKDGKWRYAVDYRGVNNITIGDSYPLPKPEDCFDSLAGSVWYSSLDLQAGYWQIPIKEADKCKTGFVTYEGTYEFNVLPFGLTNAPAKFSRVMDALLMGLKWNSCLVYLDDVIVFSKTLPGMLERLRQVLIRFKKANLKLKPSKCHLFKSKIEYLGHEVSAQGISPMPSKVAAIKDFPRPTTLKKLQSFLGLCSYYRKFYRQNFSVLAKPLYQLTEKINRANQNALNWRPEHENAFKALKDAIVSDIVLAFPDFTKPFIVQVDASNYGIGACLMQKQNNNANRPISFASRTLNKREINYSTIEKELLSILFALETFYPYLYGTHFILYSDHKPLTYLRVNQHVNPRLGRWMQKLQEFEFEIRHIAGTKNVVADALSRSPLPPPNDDGANDVCMVSKAHVLQYVTDLESPLTLDEVRDAQMEDRTLQHFRDKDVHARDAVTSTLRTLFRHLNDIYEDDGVLYLADHETCKMILPPSLHDIILFELHNTPMAGHQGVSKLVEQFNQRWYWPGSYSIIADYIRRCQDCQMFKRSYANTTAPLQPIEASAPFELVACDCIGPLITASNGYKYIFTVIDVFTRYAEAYAVPNIQSLTLVTCLEDFLATHGSPKQLLTDNAKDFESNLFRAFCQAFNITKKRTTPYHPEGNGSCERFNGTLMKILQKFVSSNTRNGRVFYLLLLVRIAQILTLHLIT